MQVGLVPQSRAVGPVRHHRYSGMAPSQQSEEIWRESGESPAQPASQRPDSKCAAAACTDLSISSSAIGNCLLCTCTPDMLMNAVARLDLSDSVSQVPVYPLSPLAVLQLGDLTDEILTQTDGSVETIPNYLSSTYNYQYNFRQASPCCLIMRSLVADTCRSLTCTAHHG